MSHAVASEFAVPGPDDDARWNVVVELWGVDAADDALDEAAATTTHPVEELLCTFERDVRYLVEQAHARQVQVGVGLVFHVVVLIIEVESNDRKKYRLFDMILRHHALFFLFEYKYMYICI